MNKICLCLLLLAVGVLSSCSTYMDAKEATRKGGTIDQQKAVASGQLASAKATNTQLQDEALQRNREIERMDLRIAAAQTDMSRQQRILADALKARRISQSRHDQLRMDLNAVQADLSAVDLQNKMDRGTSTPTAANDLAKEKKLAALEQRKKELESALAASLRK